MATNQPDGAVIEARQTLDLNLRRQAAARRLYSRAKRARHFGLGVGFGFAVAAPIVLAVFPEEGAWLGALAGLWLFVSRVFGERYAVSQQLRGAIVQDVFDRDIFGLEPRYFPSHSVPIEEVRALTENDDLSSYRQWYAVPASMEWPRSVLICMRANSVWSFRQHKFYERILFVGTFLIFLFDVCFSLAAGAPLTTYVAIVALPTLPLLLDLSHYAQRHRSTANDRQSLYELIERLLNSIGHVGSEDIRHVQDALFELRRSGPMVPDWLYHLVKRRFEQDMVYASQQVSS